MEHCGKFLHSQYISAISRLFLYHSQILTWTVIYLIFSPHVFSSLHIALYEYISHTSLLPDTKTRFLLLFFFVSFGENKTLSQFCQSVLPDDYIFIVLKSSSVILLTISRLFHK